MKKYISVIILLIIAITIITKTVYAQEEYTNIKAKVIKNDGIEEIEKDEDITKKVQKVTIRVLEGEYENEEYEMTYIISENTKSIVSNIELKEDNEIIVAMEEKDGEITNITYKETLKNQNYLLYIVGAILLVLLIVIGINTGISQMILYFLTIILLDFIIIFSMKMGWNLILVSSILSFMITATCMVRANGINIKTLYMILKSIISISFAGILISIIFDTMKLTNINIKITSNLVNLKELICSLMILVSCGICNLILLIKLNKDTFINRPYKTKSDNIIEGQRSLKL